MLFIRQLRSLVLITASVLTTVLVVQAAFPLSFISGSIPVLAAPRFVVPPVNSEGQQRDFADGGLIVKFKPGSTRASVASSLGRRGLNVVHEAPGAPFVKVAVPPGRELEYAGLLAAEADVEYAEPDHVMRAFWTPNDAYYAAYQWNLGKIGMETAWDYTRGSSSVKVAVIDSGIDAAHPDRPSNLVLERDYVNDDSDPNDDNGHGTHVAGITAAATNNATGVAGVAPGVTVIVFKGLSEIGSGSTYSLTLAVRRAADVGAKVINMSWGGSGYSQTLRDAMDYASGRGVLLVAAAGNSYQSGNPTIYPAAYPGVMAVAATGNADEHSYYSSTGSWVSVAAPGGSSGSNNSILSTIPTVEGSYAFMNGTSMAAPHVAGLAGLVLSANPALSNAQVRSIIETTAVDRGTAGRDNMYGYGRIDAAAAVRAASPALQVGTSELVFMMQPSDPNQQSQTVSVSISGTLPLSWSPSKLNGSSWLSFSPASGSGSGSLTITVSKAGLSQGTYEDYVRVTATGAQGSPQDIRVRLFNGNASRLYLPGILKQGH